MDTSCPSSHGIAHFYLQHAFSLLERGQQEHATALLKHAARRVMAPDGCSRSTAWQVGFGLEVGNVRLVNEDDAFFAAFDRTLPDGTTVPIGLFVVADGMGGHASGQQAAREAVHTCVDYVLSALLSQDHVDIRHLLREGVKRANRLLTHLNRTNGLRPGSPNAMGTTLTAALCVGSQAVVANVGDSRTYKGWPGALCQITRDHSSVADAVAAGVLSPDQLYTHPQRHLINRSLGEKDEVEVDLFPLQLAPGDVLLLCSDGLWELVPHRQMAAVVLAADCPPDTMAAQLVQLALAQGGQDNIGVIVARYQPPVMDDGMLLTTSLPFFPSASCEPGR